MNFEDYCHYMYQENITERKGNLDYTRVSFETYKQNNLSFLIKEFFIKQVQAV